MALKSIKRFILSIDGASIKLVKAVLSSILKANYQRQNSASFLITPPHQHRQSKGNRERRQKSFLHNFSPAHTQHTETISQQQQQSKKERQEELQLLSLFPFPLFMAAVHNNKSVQEKHFTHLNSQRCQLKREREESSEISRIYNCV
jgi:hypothetical protein